MKPFSLRLPLPALALAGFLMTGCEPPPTSKKAGDGHEHAHVHHGPHGGHIMEIGEEEYHAEWTHDDKSGKVTFYILNAEATKEVPIAAEDLTIEVKIGMNEPTTYKLAALNPQDGKASAFETIDKNLEGVLGTLSEGVTATIKKLTIGDKTFEDLKIEEHKH
jgi:hypothetical protein